MVRKYWRAALRLLSVYSVCMFLLGSRYTEGRDFVVAAALTALLVGLYQQIARREPPHHARRRREDRRLTRAETPTPTKGSRE